VRVSTTHSLFSPSTLFGFVLLLASVSSYACTFSCLEAEDLVLELAHWVCLFESQALGGTLHCLDHGGRATDENLDILGRRGELLLDEVLGDEASGTGPALGRIVQHIVDPEAGIVGCQRIELVLEQNVVGIDVGEEQIDFCLVAGCATADNGLDDLQHGCDACATGDHTKMPDHVGRVDHGALGAPDLHRIANLEVGDIFGNVTRRVRLDEQVEVALVVVRRGGRVRSDDWLVGVIDDRGERNVLADGEAEDVGGAREGEAVTGHVSQAC